MKKALLPLALASLMLAGCQQGAKGSECPVCPGKDSSSFVTDVDTGATDTGKGGLNFGDVDWSEDLKKEAVDTYLSGIGGNHREMMQIATVSNGKPQIASVEYYMDVTTHWFFGSSETGTGKVMDMKKDGNVALYWTRQLRAEDMSIAPNYFVSYGVEIQGKANFYTADQVNALSASDKNTVITIARGYYQSMGAQYKKYYDQTAEGYMDDATFVTTVFGSASTTPYIIKPSKIVITSPYLLFVARIDDASKEDGHYYAFQQGSMVLSEFSFLPKAFLDKCLKSVRDAKNDQTLTKFTTMQGYTSAEGLKTQVTLTF
ncbi:MAG: hypothetical protein J6328_07295 [Bacilli bacterium]|nr:hypothetical protein [Bacilli bacterium]